MRGSRVSEEYANGRTRRANDDQPRSQLEISMILPCTALDDGRQNSYGDYQQRADSAMPVRSEVNGRRLSRWAVRTNELCCLDSVSRASFADRWSAAKIKKGQAKLPAPCDVEIGDLRN